LSNKQSTKNKDLYSFINVNVSIKKIKFYNEKITVTTMNENIYLLLKIIIIISLKAPPIKKLKD